MESVATRTISKSVSESASGSEGFGLLGMVLVMLVTLAAIFITAMMVPMMASRQVKETETKGAALVAAIAAYKFDSTINAYPANLAALVTYDGTRVCGVPTPRPANGTGTSFQNWGWCGPYLDQVILENANDYQTDGWGTAFQYNSTTGAVTSCGPDRTCGTGDDITTFQ